MLLKVHGGQENKPWRIGFCRINYHPLIILEAWVKNNLTTLNCVSLFYIWNARLLKQEIFSSGILQASYFYQYIGIKKFLRKSLQGWKCLVFRSSPGEMTGTGRHELFIFWKRRRVVSRETKKCNQGRGRLSIASYRGREDNRRTDRDKIKH